MSEPRTFIVHAADDGRDAAHRVVGDSFEDAAFAFVDRWHPPADAAGDVVLMVTDCENGRRECLRLDLSDGTAEPCS